MEIKGGLTVNKHTRFVFPKHIACQYIDGEILLVPERGDTHEIVLLDGAGAAVFERLTAGYSIAETAKDSAGFLGADVEVVEADIAVFAETLAREEILAVAPSDTAPKTSAVFQISWSSPWVKPEIRSREILTVLAGFCTLAPAVCKGHGQRPVRSTV